MPTQETRPVGAPPEGRPRRAGPGTWLVTRPPLVADTVWAVPLALVLGWTQAADATGRAAVLIALVATVEVAALALRRRFPVACVVVVFSAALAHLLLYLLSTSGTDAPPLVADVAVLVALYSIAAHGPRWARWTALGGAALGALLLGSSLAFSVFLFDRISLVDSRNPLSWGVLRDLAVASTVTFVVALLAWTAGQLRRVRLAQLAATAEAGRRAQAEAEQRVLVAAGEERARIARELHDVVAHSLSVVIAQADGGRYAAASDPAAAALALETVAATGRAALTDMRRLLGVLREDSGEGGAALAPQPGVAEIAALVASVRDSGLDVALTAVGAPRPLAPSAGLALYRGVQESLTNVLKHTGPGAVVRVGLVWREGDVEVSVDDDGGGSGEMVATSGDGEGRGLRGMRERLVLHGGTVAAGPRAGGGFGVRLRLPVDPPLGRRP